MSLPLPSSLTLPKSWNVSVLQFPPCSLSENVTAIPFQSCCEGTYVNTLWNVLWKHTTQILVLLRYLQRPFQILMSFPDFSDHLQNLATASVFVSYTHAFVIFTIHACTQIYIYTVCTASFV